MAPPDWDVCFTPESGRTADVRFVPIPNPMHRSEFTVIRSPGSDCDNAVGNRKSQRLGNAEVNCEARSGADYEGEWNQRLPWGLGLATRRTP